MKDGKIKYFYELEVNFQPKKGGHKKRILGEKFVEKNKDKCKIIYKNKEYKLKEYFEDIDDHYNPLDLIIFKLCIDNNISDMSCMFYGCASLISLEDVSILNIKNIIDMSSMFYNCISLISLPDISMWNTNNVTNMNEIFYNCISLTSLPDISKWNTNCATDISGFFFWM